MSHMRPKQIVAVDWSGKKKGASEAIWLARVVEGKLVELANGRGAEQLAVRLEQIVGEDPATVVGFDFAFGFPAWWAREQDWSSAPEVWEAVKSGGDELLEKCAPPLWGRPGHKRPSMSGSGLRQTDGGTGSKSVFQIGGAGAVGTGSIRGMPLLLDLRAAGFAIWPFDEPSLPCVVEIYPRLLTGAVVKSQHAARLSYLRKNHTDQPEGALEGMLERAAGSQDAFDAAVSALAMWQHRERLTPAALADQREGGDEALEGRIWQP